MIDSFCVTQANKKIYNQLADKYEIIDARRSQDLSIWLRKRLEKVSTGLGANANILDIGCGEGFVLKSAKGLFYKMYGIDISKKILRTLFTIDSLPICADAQEIPLKKNSIDVVVLFSVMHHLYDYRPILKEIHRILKTGGIVYMDHDLDKTFYMNYKFFINMYRRLSHKERAIEDLEIDKELYKLSEFHSDGIDSRGLENYLASLGFKVVESYYHWYGLFNITNLLIGEKKLFCGIAPLYGCLAQKF